MMKIALVTLGFLLSSCVPTREPVPVALKLSSDSGLTCEMMAAEYRANTHIAKEKIVKNIRADKKDIFLAILVWPGLVDFKNADGTEGNALLDRNTWLRELGLLKNCIVADWPQQPERYSPGIRRSRMTQASSVFEMKRNRPTRYNKPVEKELNEGFNTPTTLS